MRREGTGGRPVSTAYYNQGLDLATRMYLGRSLRESVMLSLACAFVRKDRAEGFESSVTKNAGDWKYEGQFTPFGTPVAGVVRAGGEMLVARCGNCQVAVTKCKCAIVGPAEW